MARCPALSKRLVHDAGVVFIAPLLIQSDSVPIIAQDSQLDVVQSTHLCPLLGGLHQQFAQPHASCRFCHDKVNHIGKVMRRDAVVRRGLLLLNNNETQRLIVLLGHKQVPDPTRSWAG